MAYAIIPPMLAPKSIPNGPNRTEPANMKPAPIPAALRECFTVTRRLATASKPFNAFKNVALSLFILKSTIYNEMELK